MAFIVDSQELKPGLILFRRSDVKHKNWYCRVKVRDARERNPERQRYKTISLKTSRLDEARDKAFDHDADIRFRKKHEVPIFDKSFADVAKEYSARFQTWVDAGEKTNNLKKLHDSIVSRFLIPYLGNVQIITVNDDKWRGYPAWRKKTGKGLYEGPPRDATIRKELISFRSILAFAAEKGYIRENQVPKSKMAKGDGRRDEFTPQEYRQLHTFARGWIKTARNKPVQWARSMAYNFMLVMTNTGMRATEAKNLRWSDVHIRQDKQGRTFVVLFVHGKGKYRELVAANNVAEYFDRIRAISKATGPDDFVFSTYTGKRTETIYQETIRSLLTDSGLLLSKNKIRRCSTCFRHTYATFRLMEGIDVYFLAKQMGTSVKMIEEHYGHITPSKNAERILEGVPGWETISEGAGPVVAVVNDGGAEALPDKPRKKKA